MATPFFGKRESESTPTRPLTPQSPVGAPLPATNPSAATLPVTRTGTSGTTAPQAPAAPTGGSKLTVGPNIKLKGVEITDCDTLVVEGLVEATMDSRLMQIAEIGAFKGSAEIDIAEIRGTFEGDLTVRDRLVIHSTGKVTGTIRYGKIVIEEGGQISGDITCERGRAPTASNAPALQMAA